MQVKFYRKNLVSMQSWGPIIFA